MIVRSDNNIAYDNVMTPIYNDRVIADGGTIETLTEVEEVLSDLGDQDVVPSLLWVAEGSKVGKDYSILPNDGSGDFDVTRPGDTAFTQNPDLTWRPALPNEPRFTYENGVKGRLVENAATRLNTHPFSFENAAWTKSGLTVDTNSGAGYDCPFVDANGINTKQGRKLVATANSGSVKLTTPVAVTDASQYVNSVYIKRLVGTGTIYLVDVNNTDRAVTVTSNWTRVEYAAAAAGTSGQLGVKLATAGDEVLICYAPIVAGTVATSPIGGAEGSAQTRNADEIKDTDDYSAVKTLVINNDAYVIDTALPNNGYTLEQKAHEKILMFDSILSDAVIAERGWTKKQLAFSAYVNVAAGTTVSIEVGGIGTIEWGDGTSDSYSSQVTKTKVYTTGYKGLIKFVGMLTRFNSGSNVNWYFNIKDLPSVMTYFRCTGSNTVTGNIADLPAVMTSFTCTGSNTVTGNIADLPAVMTSFTCTGSNTVTGNIADLPAVMTYFFCIGSNTVTGNIADLPAVMTSFYCDGSNTITGNIADLPSVMTYFRCTGSNTINNYTSGRTWANNQLSFFIRQATGYGLDSTEVDNLLIDLANVSAWTGTKTIDIRGVNAARTSASNAAVATLQGKGVTVLTN